MRTVTGSALMGGRSTMIDDPPFIADQGEDFFASPAGILGAMRCDAGRRHDVRTWGRTPGPGNCRPTRDNATRVSKHSRCAAFTKAWHTTGRSRGRVHRTIGRPGPPPAPSTYRSRSPAADDQRAPDRGDGTTDDQLVVSAGGETLCRSKYLGCQAMREIVDQSAFDVLGKQRTRVSGGERGCGTDLACEYPRSGDEILGRDDFLDEAELFGLRRPDLMAG
jgi:hypothetical protein